MSEQGHLLTAHCRNCSGTCFRACEGKLECYHCALESELSSLRAERDKLRIELDEEYAADKQILEMRAKVEDENEALRAEVERLRTDYKKRR